MLEENKIIIYTTEDGKEKFEVNLKEETVWLSLHQISKLFERDKSVYFKTYKKCI